MQDDQSDPTDLAAGLSTALKDLHRALMRAELGDDARLANPYTMLFALIDDPNFAWMRMLSRLAARIDEWVADEEARKPGDLEAFRMETAALLGEGGGVVDAGFRLRHLEALRTHPDVGLATGRLRRALAALPPRPA
jgi:hypothetical protein